MTDYGWARARRAGRDRVVSSAVVLVVGLGTAGCSAGIATQAAPGGGSSASSVVSTPAIAPSSLPPAPAVAAVAVPTARAAAPPSARPAGTAGVVVNAAGAVLPDAHRTPGALNPAVTQANIHSTICVPGWTATVRPPSGYTTDLKIEQLASGYAYHHDRNPGDYEEDHLISLELGGSPTATANLWPEPYFATDGARTKDRIENRLHALVCSGVVGLATAQHAIAANWWVAYNVYGGTAPARRPSTAPRSTASPVSAPADGATAQCNDGTYSYAAHHQGACSHHGGVKIFYN